MPSSLSNKRILLGISGGIAAYKIPHLVRLLKKAGAEVQVLMTESAKQFVSELTLATLSGKKPYSSILPKIEHGTEDYTAHISLGEWADALLIAPLTANTLAKLATGICDSMLTTAFITLRPDKPILLFPAMDGEMYRSPSVQRNIATLTADGCTVVPPESGALASGLCGAGRMPEPEAIVAHLEQALTQATKTSLLKGKSVVVTAGPTREKIDGVRFISNYSSGKMGFALAAAAAQRGAHVTLISGAVQLATPLGVERINVESAMEMYAAVEPFFATADVFIGAAAVADYRPATTTEGKRKKDGNSLQITLVENPDILKAFGQQKSQQQLAAGFALESHNGLAHAAQKLREKALDLIAYNSFDGTSCGFEVETNILTLITQHGNPVQLPLMSKDDAASHYIDALEALLIERLVVPTSASE